jgi:type IV pilus assembly protein PilN
MRITLNLATRPYSDFGPVIKLLRISMAVLLVISLGLGIGLRAFHQKAKEARATEQVVQSKIDGIIKERQGYQQLMQQPANAQLLTQAEALNQLFDEKTFSWTLAMEDLETVLPGGVQVSTLEPVRDTKTGAITVKLRVVGPRDKGDDMVQNLEHSKHFLLPHIVSESYESTGSAAEKLEPISASNRFTFELQAEYNSASPEDRKDRNKQKQDADEKSGDAGMKTASPSASPSHAAHLAPLTAGGVQLNRPALTGSGQAKPHPNHFSNPNPNSGGPR